MRRVFSVLLGVMISAVGAAAAQEPAPAPTAKNAASPFKFAFGVQEKGGVGASLKGEDVRPLGGGVAHAFFLLSSIDAHFDSKIDSPDQAIVSVKPGIVLFTPKGGLFYDLAATVEVGQRFGEFKTTAGDVENVSQTLAGVSVIWIPKWFQKMVRTKDISEETILPDCVFTPEGCKVVKIPLDAPPKVTFTYYRAFNESTATAALPQGIDADKIIGKLAGDLPVVRKLRYPIRFVFDLSATKPTTGAERDLETKVDVGIGVRLKQFTPLLRYVTGEEGGFKYDKQVLLGLLWRFAGLPVD